MTRIKQKTALQTSQILSNAQYYLWSMHRTLNFYLQHCDLDLEFPNVEKTFTEFASCEWVQYSLTFPRFLKHCW